MRLSLHINCTIFLSFRFSFDFIFSHSFCNTNATRTRWMRRGRVRGVVGVDNALTHSQCLTYFQRCRRRRRCHLPAYIAQRVRQRQRQKRRHGMVCHGTASELAVSIAMARALPLPLPAAIWICLLAGGERNAKGAGEAAGRALGKRVWQRGHGAQK